MSVYPDVHQKLMVYSGLIPILHLSFLEILSVVFCEILLTTQQMDTAEVIKCKCYKTECHIVQVLVNNDCVISD